MAHFRADLAITDWSTVMNVTDPEVIYEEFHSKYKDLFNKHFPLRRISKKNSKHKDWVTKGLIVSIKHKTRLYRKYLKRPTEQNNLKYKRYKNKLSTVLRKCEKDYYKKLLK